MISLSNRIKAFQKLGTLLSEVGHASSDSELNNKLLNKLNLEVTEAVLYNGWFVESNVRYMLKAIGKSLSTSNLEKWIEPYIDSLINNKKHAQTIAVVMAGNIPLVGFHDFLCVLISGNGILAKLSSDDNRLLPLVSELLVQIEPDFSNMIKFTDGKIEKPDAIIATGSNNSSRYFDYYFGKYPNIIRKNRNGIAVLTGKETKEDLENIIHDISMYYGMGCRNVSHLFVPVEYDFTPLLDIISSDESINNNHKYFNNYEYNKAIYLVNSTSHLDSGNLLVTENTEYSTPVSVISFEYYSDISHVNSILSMNKEKVQCIVSNSEKIAGRIPPGTSQSPELWDYADGVDTMKFLLDL